MYNTLGRAIIMYNTLGRAGGHHNVQHAGEGGRPS